jgi:hypothetical protein
MVTFEELEASFQALPPAGIGRGQLHLIVVRTGGGAHTTPAQVAISPKRGLDGDRWSKTPKREVDGQVSLMDARVASLLVGGERDRLHLPGDNFHVDLDLGEAALPVGSQLRLGTALLEITALPHAGCAKFRARFGDDALRWVNHRSFRARRLRGVFCRILEGGVASLGDAIAVER